jgi:hypothetical protein
MFYNFLNEVASHGFMIVANGRSNETTVSRQTSYRDLIKSADWVLSNPAAKKYGNIDTSRLVVSGQSCGGMEAVSLWPVVRWVGPWPMVPVHHSNDRSHFPPSINDVRTLFNEC